MDFPAQTTDGKNETLDSYPLDWIVLSYDAENKRALLLSQYVFRDLMPYGEYSSWSSSSLRKWLNSEFFNGAFFEDEKATILPTQIDSSTDYVFLLSKDEAELYFSDGKIEKKGAFRSSETDDYRDWWLRPGSQGSVYEVTSYGSYYATTYPDLSEGVRPAIWVDVQSIISVPYANYQRGVSLLAEKHFDEATQAFMNARRFNGANELALEAQYQKAESLFAAGEYDSAATVFAGIIDYKDSLNKAKESLYQNAKSSINSKDFATAYDALALIPGYLDADQLLKTNEGLINARKSRFSTVGATVRFGKYEQDGITSNGKENIKWIVLAYDSTANKALLLSKYVLDYRPFDEKKSYSYPGWADSSAHKWIESTFITNAFDKEEQSQIATTTVSTPDYKPYYGSTTSGGPNTQDKVFLLSSEEVKKYLKKDDKAAAPTQYAVQQGVRLGSVYETSEGLSAASWWLRDPKSSSEANMVYLGGDFLYASANSKEGIRPALWINLP